MPDRQKGIHPGHSTVLFADPFANLFADLPGKRPLAWKVPRKNAGPSGKTGTSMEGPPEKRRTFRENNPFPGRFPRWGGSRPPKEAFWWMAKGKRADHPRKSPFWWMAKARGGTGRHEATCHPRLGGACEAMALRRESRRGSPVLPWLAGSNKGSRVQQEQTGSRECCLGTPRAARTDACSKSSRAWWKAGAWRRAGGVSRCSIRGCPRDGDGCRPSGSGCNNRPCARRNTRSCRRSRDAGPAGTGSRIACWRG